ncbi:hypothetical protein ACIQOU_00470 [Streptomyces sp. NPDC091279]|uniref:hypothetical protein n=1 Tax=Streptomyces sp. NPDC091279 TaxID=3365983 RepID=UPI00381AF86F
MSLPPRPGLFTSVERQCADLNPAPELQIPDGANGAGAPIALDQVRPVLYDRDAEPAVRSTLWHQIAERGRLDSDRSDWPTAVVWLGLPGLRRHAVDITRRFCAERDDVEAELVTCYLEALADVTADTPDPGRRVLRSAVSRAWALWRRTRPEAAVADLGGTEGPGTDTEGLWQTDHEPPARPDGMSAGARITVPAHRAEGVRIGALAQAWGLSDTATRYAGRGRQIATISLRRVGKDR